MWGTWFILTLGATAGVVLLVVGLAFGGWSVLVAAALFAVIGAIMLAAAGFRRSGEYLEHGEEGESAPTGESEHPRGGGRPRSGGAPASGEGE